MRPLQISCYLDAVEYESNLDKLNEAYLEVPAFIREKEEEVDDQDEWREVDEGRHLDDMQVAAGYEL